MQYVFYAILFAGFFTTFAMMVQLGLWSNMITLINIMLSGLIAFGFYLPLGGVIIEKASSAASYTMLLDFIFIWLIYVIAFVVLQRIFTNNLSRTRMRFKHPIDTVGGPIVAAIAGWMMAGFLGATLHIAPLEEDCFEGMFTSARDVYYPDISWLKITEAALGDSVLGADETPFTAQSYVQNGQKFRAFYEKQEKNRLDR